MTNQTALYEFVEADVKESPDNLDLTNYKDEAKQLVQNLNQRMGPSAYDTAWLARLRGTTNGEARWPDLLTWLLNNQRPDGSWGGEIPYYHDRIICTLSAAIALRENEPNHQAQKAIKRAERYLQHALYLLHQDPFELCGFELLFPALITEARTLGLNVPNHTGSYGKIRIEKLRLVPSHMLYSPNSTIVHSLEFLGQSADKNRIHRSLTSNGSIGNSPATTAYYLRLTKHDHEHQLNHERALAYLKGIREHMGHVNYLYPFRGFELTWVLNNLIFCGRPITQFAGQDVWQRLRSAMSPQGIGLDPTFGINDGDSTSVTSRLLIQAGYDVDPCILAQFEEGVFRTYHYERNTSVGTNVHALEALDLMPDYPNRREVKERVIIALLEERIANAYWIDKWHISPYYATAHVLVRLLKEKKTLAHICHDIADWFLHTQREDGSWGFFDRGTAEETAYALTALLHYHQHEPIDVDVLHQGATYLASRHQGVNSTYPELWIGKCLYTPDDVVRSAILSALILYEDTFGRSP